MIGISKNLKESSDNLPMKFSKDVNEDEKGDLSFKDLAGKQNSSQEDMESSITDTSNNLTYSPSQKITDSKDISYSQGDDDEYTSEDNNNPDGNYSEDEIIVSSKAEKGNPKKTLEIVLSELDGNPKRKSEMKDVAKKNKSLKSPKSKETQIKEYTSKIDENGITYMISGQVSDVAKLMEVSKSDMGGFKPRSPVKFTSVMWNDTMLKNSSQQQPVISTEDVQSADIVQPEVIDDELLPSHEEHDNLLTLEPKSTSTPKVDKHQVDPNEKPSHVEESRTENNSTKNKIHNQEVDKTLNKPEDNVDTSYNAEEENSNSTTTSEDVNTDATNTDDSNKPPPSFKKVIPDKEFEKIFKGNCIE